VGAARRQPDQPAASSRPTRTGAPPRTSDYSALASTLNSIHPHAPHQELCCDTICQWDGPGFTWLAAGVCGLTGAELERSRWELGLPQSSREFPFCMFTARCCAAAIEWRV
jgi:hypothetical protein